MGFAKENTQLSETIAKNPGITSGEIAETEEFRRTLNRRWDSYNETLVARNKLGLKQSATLLEALLAKVLGGGMHEYIVAAPTEKFVSMWKQMGYEMLTRRVFGSDWNDGSAISYGVHEEPDGTLMWGATKQHYLMFTRKDIWQRRQQQIQAENEENMRRHVPDRQEMPDPSRERVPAGVELTGSERKQETVQTRSRSSIQGKRGPGRPRKE